ncbi:MAG: tetratricopeptide repeat protein, partial [Rhodospirillaceae bacterium]
MNPKIPLPDTAGFYLEIGSAVLSRCTSKLISGFQSIFVVDDDAKTNYYRKTGIEHTKNGRYERALPLLDYVSARRPDDLEIMLHLGLCQIKLGRKEDGMKLLEAAQLLDSTNPNTTKVLGL